MYWARTRTLEYLSSVLPNLPEGVKTELGPDATGLGWVFQYVLTDTSGKHTLDELRSYQDWFLRYHLKAVPGVAEVAPIGGAGRQYQINLDPNRLQQYGISTSRVVEAVRAGNTETGGRLLEFGGTEYMVRGRGYLRSIQDIENIVLAASETGTPIRVRDVGEVTFGPDIRRGVSDLDGEGEAVSGIIVMRHGENALDVIERVKAIIRQIEPGLPEGVKIVPIYDRSDLINRSIGTVKTALIEVIITVCLIVLLFLWHVPSALIPMITIPVAVLIAFIPFREMGVTANIMSLAGIAIAIGALVDASIVVVEQAHKRLEENERSRSPRPHRAVVLEAVQEVGSPSFFALLVIAVAFLPVLALEASEGRLFKPLAYTKNLTMLVAALLAITLDPALRLWFTHLRNFSFRPRWLCRAANAVLVGRIHSESGHPVSRLLMRVYGPAAEWALRWRWAVIGGALALMLATAVTFSAIGAVWFLYLLGYNMSVGVWVGLIALLGVDAETGVFMLLYLDLAYDRARREGRLRTRAELRDAILSGAVKRIRPKFMTVATDFIGLIPIMWATGAGSDVMKHIAAPLIGGVFSSFMLELLVYPAIYELWKWNFELKRGARTGAPGESVAIDFDRPGERVLCPDA